MLRHVVMFTWSDDVDDDHVAATSAALDALPELIDVIRRYEHGPDAGLGQANADYVVVADFDDDDGYVTYRDHPDHQAMIAANIAGRVDQRLAVQYHVEG